MKPLWIVSDIFYPNQTSTGFIMTSVADEMALIREVKVICAEPVNSEIHSGKSYSIIRTATRFRNKSKSSVSKLVSSVISSFAIFWKVLILCPTGAEVLTVTNPTLLVPFWWILIKLKKIKVSIIVHDVFPENAVVAGYLKREQWIFKGLKFLFASAYKKFTNIISIGRDMSEIMAEKVSSNKIKLIENWSNLDSILPVNKKRESTIELLYAGNVGILQNLDKLIEAFSKTRNRTINLTIKGDGSQVPLLKRKVAEMDIKNIQFSGGYQRTEESEILSKADLSIVSLKNDMYGLGVPSKAYNIMASDRPILYLGNPDSEIGRVVKSNFIGEAFSENDENALVSYFDRLTPEILKNYNSSRDVAEKYFSQKQILEKYKALFQ